MTASVNAAPPPADQPSGGRPSGTEPMSQARLDRFESEVSDLKVTGGAANPERQGSRLGIGLMVIALIGGFLCWYAAFTATRFEEIQRMIIAGGLFVGVGVVGAVIWVRNSFTRYLRYWLIRLIYEQREQTDSLVAEQREQMDRLIELVRSQR
jgi:hypothetical protein